MNWKEELKKKVTTMICEGNISDVASKVIPEFIPYIKLSEVESFIESLLKKQREICAEHLHKNNGCSGDCEECEDDMNVIKSAPEPEGSEK